MLLSADPTTQVLSQPSIKPHGALNLSFSLILVPPTILPYRQASQKPLTAQSGCEAKKDEKKKKTEDVAATPLATAAGVDAGHSLAPPTFRDFQDLGPFSSGWTMAKRPAEDDVIVSTDVIVKKPKFSIETLLDDGESSEDNEEIAVALSPTETTPSATTPTPKTPAARTKEGNLAVDCQLEGAELWTKFYDLGTEMIITKSGRSRRMVLAIWQMRRDRQKRPQLEFFVGRQLTPPPPFHQMSSSLDGPVVAF
ncbi:unnamed protein product [Caenorhabditis auriculariae]|uniref:T-box domain-containing protein n=1 Tax=Caenorhabditis auriculariae TaxID=2777116 RepID=A0A8S1HCI3_9PELO|nr:unnamed protein product [Caenorhabditis auriculariae]